MICPGVGQNTARNDTDTPQTISIALLESSTDTRTFEHSWGLNIEVKAGVTFGWVKVIEGKLELTTAVKKEWKWGTQTSDTKTCTTTVNVAAKPWSKVTAIATATKSDIELPFTITWKSKKTGYKVQTKGVYKGTNYWNSETQFKQATQSENREINPGDDSEEWEEVEPIERVVTSVGYEDRSFDNDSVEGQNHEYEDGAPQCAGE